LFIRVDQGAAVGRSEGKDMKIRARRIIGGERRGE
jgi:hypothetical protein